MLLMEIRVGSNKGFTFKLRLKILQLKGGRIAQWIAYLLFPLRPRVQLSAYPRFFSEIFISLLDVGELIDSKDSAIKLNKLIEPIQYW